MRGTSLIKPARAPRMGQNISNPLHRRGVATPGPVLAPSLLQLALECLDFSRKGIIDTDQ